jgi:putative transport protein
LPSSAPGYSRWSGRRVERDLGASISLDPGGALAGLLLGYLRTVHPTFGNIPAPSLWLMNTLGLNIFIAIVGISAGPGFVAGLQKVGLSLFLWGARATTIPRHRHPARSLRFKFHPAIQPGAAPGCVPPRGARMIQKRRRARFPRSGTGCPTPSGHATHHVGMVIVLLLTRG